MKLARLSPIALAVSGAIVLSACGGGGGGSSSSGTAAPVSVTVTPSLGKFSTACTVEVRKSNGDLLGSAPVAGNGTATVSIPGDYTGAIIAQVKGATGCTYFDEVAGDTPFGADRQLSAVVDSVRSNLGVNALTNLAAARLLDGNKLAAGKSSDNIKTENATVQLMFQVGDMFAAPTLIGKSTDTIDNTEAGKLAAKLAALAEIAQTLSKDVATLAAELATDLRDGTLNGIENTQFQNALTAAVNKFADASSKAALLDLPANTTLRTDTAAVKADADKVLAAGTALQQAKQIFADLRTSLMSISNEAGTGSLDVQSTQLEDDFLNGADFTTLIDNLSLMTEALGILNGTESEVYSTGTPSYCNGYQGVLARCDLHDSDKGLIYTVELRPTANPTIVAWQTVSVYSFWTDSLTEFDTPVLNGTISNNGNTFAILGKLYPMAGDAARTDVDVTLGYSATPGAISYNGSGTLNAVKTDGVTSVLKMNISEFAVSEANKTVKVVTSLISPHHRFDGTLTLDGITVTKDGQSNPQNGKLVGSFTNTATGFKFFEGTLTGSNDLSKLDRRQRQSANNYSTFTVSFKGTAYKSPSAPGVTLDLTTSNPSFAQRTAEFTFTGSNGLSITGSGVQTHTTDGNLPSTWTLSNANGIKATYDDATKSGKIMKADGTTLGTISNQRVTFIDGTFESLI